MKKIFNIQNILFIALILLSIFSLSSCSKGKKKINNLVLLTTKIETDVKNAKIHIKPPTKVTDLRLKESLYKNSSKPIICKPAIAKKILYSLHNDGSVMAFSLKTKKLIWKRQLQHNKIKSKVFYNKGGILFSNNKLYVTNNSQLLFTLDPKTGNEIFRKKLPDLASLKPAMIDDKFLLVQTDKYLCKYDIETKKIVSYHKLHSKNLSSYNHAGPLVRNNHVLLSDIAGHVYYINLANNKVKWMLNLYNVEEHNNNMIHSISLNHQLFMDGKYIYGATDNYIVKIAVNSGKIVWRKYVENILSVNMIDNYIFVTSNARQVAAISTKNGKILWDGYLSSQDGRKANKIKKIQTVQFTSPFLTKDNQIFLNVIGTNKTLYQFKYNPTTKKLPKEPRILAIPKNIIYYHNCCCTGLYLIGKFANVN